MRFPADQSSAVTLHDEYGLYHLARLQGDEETSDLAIDFGHSQDGIKLCIDQEVAARAASMRALAIRDAADQGLDKRVRAFSFTILAHVNSNREAPLYRTYFPDGLAAVVSAPLDTELTRIGSIQIKLQTETVAELLSHTEPLRIAADRAREAREAHREAVAAQTQARSVLRAEVLRWLDAYKRSYRELQRRFYQDPDRADSYFRNPARTRPANGQGENATVSAPLPGAEVMTANPSAAGGALPLLSDADRPRS